MDGTYVDKLYDGLSKEGWVTVDKDKFVSSLQDEKYVQKLYDGLSKEEWVTVDYDKFKSSLSTDPLKKKEDSTYTSQSLAKNTESPSYSWGSEELDVPGLIKKPTEKADFRADVVKDPWDKVNRDIVNPGLKKTEPLTDPATIEYFAAKKMQKEESAAMVRTLNDDLSIKKEQQTAEGTADPSEYFGFRADGQREHPQDLVAKGWNEMAAEAEVTTSRRTDPGYFLGESEFYVKTREKNLESLNKQIEEVATAAQGLVQRLEAGEITEEEFKPAIEELKANDKQVRAVYNEELLKYNNDRELLHIDKQNVINAKEREESAKGNFLGASWNSLITSIDEGAQGLDDFRAETAAMINYPFDDKKQKNYLAWREGRADKATKGELGTIENFLYAKGTIAEAASSEGTTDAYVQRLSEDNAVSEAYFGVMKSLPMMMTPGMIGIGAQVYGEVGNKMKESDAFSNIPVSEQVALKSASAAVSMALEKFGFKHVKGVPKAGFSEGATALSVSVTNQIFKEMGQTFTHKSFQKAAKSVIGKYAKSTALAMVAEGETGAAQYIVQAGMEELYDTAKGINGFQNAESLEEFASETWKNWRGEALGGGMMHAPYGGARSVIGSFVNKKKIDPAKFSFLEQAVLGGYNTERINTFVDHLVGKGEMTEKEAIRVKQSFANVQNVLEQVPKDLQNEAKSELTPILVEKAILEKKNNLTEIEKARLERIPKEIDEIVTADYQDQQAQAQKLMAAVARELENQTKAEAAAPITTPLQSLERSAQGFTETLDRANNKEAIPETDLDAAINEAWASVEEVENSPLISRADKDAYTDLMFDEIDKLNNYERQSKTKTVQPSKKTKNAALERARKSRKLDVTGRVQDKSVRIISEDGTEESGTVRVRETGLGPELVIVERDTESGSDVFRETGAVLGTRSFLDQSNVEVQMQDGNPTSVTVKTKNGKTLVFNDKQLAEDTYVNQKMEEEVADAEFDAAYNKVVQEVAPREQKPLPTSGVKEVLDNQKDVVRDSATAQEIAINEGDSTLVDTILGVYNVMRDKFGLGRIKAFATAVVYHQTMKVIAARSGVPVKEAYRRYLRFATADKNTLEDIEKRAALWQVTTSAVKLENGTTLAWKQDSDMLARERFNLGSLKRIGAGSDRIVFDLGDGKVLKVAKTARGLYQNSVEGEWFLSDIIPEKFEHGLNYVVVEKFPKANKNMLVNTYVDEQIGNQVTLGDMVSELKAAAANATHISDMQEVLRKYGLGDLGNYYPTMGDLGRISSWSVNADGNPILVDAGVLVDVLSFKNQTKEFYDADFREFTRDSRRLKKELEENDKYTKFQGGKGIFSIGPSLKLFHGSPYLFDEFDSSKIGSGEGVQAFGWGLYMTEEEFVAMDYAKKLAANKIAFNQFKVETKNSGTVTFGDVLKTVVLPFDSSTTLASVSDAVQIALSSLKTTDQNTISSKDFAPELIRELSSLVPRSEAVRISEAVLWNVSRITIPRGMVYSVKTKGAGVLSSGTYAEWYKPVSNNVLNKIKAQAKKEGILKEVDGNGKIEFIISVPGMDGWGVLKGESFRSLYDGPLSHAFRGQKNASLFLQRAGVDGIQYPVGSVAGGYTGNKSNFVIFNSNELQVEGRRVVWQDAQGAMAQQGSMHTIYALTNPNVSTPLHELAHVFESFMSGTEKKAVMNWLGHDTWTRETSEGFARGFEKFLSEGVAPNRWLQVFFNKFKQWLTDIYNGITGSDIDLKLTDEARQLYQSMLQPQTARRTELEITQQQARYQASTPRRQPDPLKTKRKKASYSAVKKRLLKAFPNMPIKEVSMGTDEAFAIIDNGVILVNSDKLDGAALMKEAASLWYGLMTNMNASSFNSKSFFYTEALKSPEFKSQDTSIPEDKRVQNAIIEIIANDATSKKPITTKFWDAFIKALKKIGIDVRASLHFPTMTFDDFTSKAAKELSRGIPLTDSSVLDLQEAAKGKKEIMIDSALLQMNRGFGKKLRSSFNFWYTSDMGLDREAARLVESIKQVPRAAKSVADLEIRSLVNLVKKEYKNDAKKVQDALIMVNEYWAGERPFYDLPESIRPQAVRVREMIDNYSERYLEYMRNTGQVIGQFNENLDIFLTNNFNLEDDFESASDQLRAYHEQEVSQYQNVKTQEEIEFAYEYLQLEALGLSKEAMKFIDAEVSAMEAMNLDMDRDIPAREMELRNELRDLYEKMRKQINVNEVSELSEEEQKRKLEEEKAAWKEEDDTFFEFYPESAQGETMPERVLLSQIEYIKAIINMNTGKPINKVTLGKMLQKKQALETKITKSHLDSHQVFGTRFEYLPETDSYNFKMYQKNGNTVDIKGVSREDAIKMFGNENLIQSMMDDTEGYKILNPVALMKNNVLYERIRKNGGTYLNRSYMKHDFDNYAEHVKSVIGWDNWIKVTDYIRNQFNDKSIVAVRKVSDDRYVFTNRLGVVSAPVKSLDIANTLEEMGVSSRDVRLFKKAAPGVDFKFGRPTGRIHNFAQGDNSGIQFLLTNEAMMTYINKVLSDEEINSSAGVSVGEMTLDSGILKKKKNLPEAMRILLGEYTDPVITGAKTLANVKSLVEGSELRKELIDSGMGKYFSPTESKSFNKKLPDGYYPTDVYTTEEVARVLEDTGIASSNTALKTIQYLSATTKAMLTVGSSPSNARNFLGALMMMSNSGNIGGLGHLNKSAQVVFADFTKGDKIAAAALAVPLALVGAARQHIPYAKMQDQSSVSDLYAEVMGLGLLNSAADIGVIEEVFRSTANEKPSVWWNEVSGKKNNIGKFLDKAKDGIDDVAESARKTYQTSDALFKVAGYFWNKNELIKDGMDPKEASIRAADIVKDTIATYERVPRVVKWWSQFELAGNFIMFRYEQLRTMVNTIKIGLQEVKEGVAEGNVRKRNRGIQRVGAKSLSVGAFNIMGAKAIWALLGYDDDDENFLRRLFPEYSRRGALIPYANKDEFSGTFKYLDLSFILPGNDYSKMWVALTQEDYSLAEGAIAAGEELLAGWSDIDVFLGYLLEGYKGIDGYGHRIYNSTDGGFKQFTSRGIHVTQALVPGTVKKANDILIAIAQNMEETNPDHWFVSTVKNMNPSRYGLYKQDISNNLLEHATGIRLKEVVLGTRAKYEFREYYNKEYQDLRSLDPDKTGYKSHRANKELYETRREVFLKKDLAPLFNATWELLGKREAIKAMEDGGFSKKMVGETIRAARLID